MVVMAPRPRAWLSAWWSRRSGAQQDGLLYAALVATGLATWLLQDLGGPVLADAAQLSATVLGPLSVLLRRRYPLIALLAAGGLLVGVAALGLDSGVEITALAVVLVSSVAADPRLHPVPVFVGAAVIVNVVSLLDARRLGQPVDVNSFVFGTFGCALAIGLGVVLRRHRAALLELAARNAELEHARVAEARAAVADERVRIAREMHDVVAHHVSAILVRARAAEHVRQRRPDEVGPTLRYVVTAAGETLTALRRLVGVLRAPIGAGEDEEDGRASAVEPPQPTLTDLPRLVDRAREAGQDVTLRQTGRPRRVSADLELAVYRVVQEALTNALRHAPGAPVVVEVDWTTRRLDVRVVNGSAGRSAVRRLGGGHGLVGMHERLGMYGGTLTAGVTSAGGWAVSAGLPLPSDAGADLRSGGAGAA